MAKDQRCDVLMQKLRAMFCPGGGPVGKHLAPADCAIGGCEAKEHGGPVAHHPKGGGDGARGGGAEDVGLNMVDGHASARIIRIMPDSRHMEMSNRRKRSSERRRKTLMPICAAIRAAGMATARFHSTSDV